jgi:hypothetical protein
LQNTDWNLLGKLKHLYHNFGLFQKKRCRKSDIFNRASRACRSRPFDCFRSSPIELSSSRANSQSIASPSAYLCRDPGRGTPLELEARAGKQSVVFSRLVLVPRKRAFSARRPSRSGLARGIPTHDGPGCGVREDDVGRRLASSPGALLRRNVTGQIIPVARKVSANAADSGALSPA